ncbi:MAG: Crp/Fnr family transcriptional regulator [Armatimonadota bacterium]
MQQERRRARPNLLTGLPAEDRERLLRGLPERVFEKDEVIIVEDEQTATFFLIKEGRVKISRSGGQDKEAILAYLGPGDFFGEMSVIDGRPRSATATAMERTSVLIGGPREFEQRVLANPRVALSLMRILSQRLRDANGQIERLSVMDAQARVAGILLDLAESEGERAENGTVVLRMRYTRPELASLAGITRETLIRVLRTLEALGCIKRMRGKMLLRDMDRLRRLSLG